MAIGDDFSVDYTNKRVYHSANNNTYTVRAFYSWLMDEFDEQASMDDPVPMKALTPNEFQMINEWFLDIGEDSEAHKYLKEGAIETVGYNGAIRLLKLESFGAHTFDSDDIGGEIGYAGGSPADAGELLGYDNTNFYIWVRTTDSFSNTTTSLDLDDTTSLDDLIDSNGSLTGEELYANIYTLGTIETNPYGQIYVMQESERIAEWSDKNNWDRGHIDVLIQVKEMGTEIASGVIIVFLRQSGDLFDHFEIDLTNGGRNAVPLGTGDDLNNDTPENYLLIDNVASGTPTVGNIIYHPTSGDVQWYAEIKSATNITGAEWLLGLQGLRKVGGADIIDNDACGNGTWTADVNGTEGDAYFDYTPGTDFTTNGQLLTQATSGALALQRGYSAAGDTIVCEVDTTQVGSNLDDYIINFNTSNTVSGATTGSATPDNYARGVAGFVDITIAHVNGTVTVSSISGSFEVGEIINYTNPSASCVYVYDNGSNSMTLANVDSANEPTATSVFTGASSGATCNCDSVLTDDNDEDFNFEQQSGYSYNVVIECGAVYRITGYGRALAQVYQYLKYVLRDGSTFQVYTSDGSSITVLDGQEYQRAVSTHPLVKGAPYGTFAGGVFFGAQGIWVEGMASADANNIQLTDEDGNVQTPYTSITVKVSNTVSGDRVGVYLDDGSGDIDKDTFTSHATNNSQSNSTLEIQEDIPVDTPSTGNVIVVAVDENEEHIYRYTSWTGKIFTLMAERTGTADADSSGNTLEDDGATFVTWGIKYGDIIKNTTDGTWGYVVSVTDEDTLVTITGFGSNTLAWSDSDNYEIGSLVQGYDGSDTVYVPYILEKATTTSVEKNVLYAETSRDVIIRARNVEAVTPILPFETTSSITSGGMTVAVIRTEDTVYQ